MSKTEKFLNKLIQILLKVASIGYIFSVILPYLIDPGFESTFGSWSTRWLLIILLAAYSLLVFVLSRTQFYLYGFFVVSIAALFKLFVILLSPINIVEQLMLHIYVLVTAFYFISKDLRMNYASGKKHRTSTKRQ